MSIDYIIRPVVGFRVDIKKWLKHVKPIVREERRYNPMTGEPVMPVTIEVGGFCYVEIGKRCFTSEGEISQGSLRRCIAGELLIEDAVLCGEPLSITLTDFFAGKGIRAEYIESDMHAPFNEMYLCPPSTHDYDAGCVFHDAPVTIYEPIKLPTEKQLATLLNRIKKLNIPIYPKPICACTMYIS